MTPVVEKGLGLLEVWRDLYEARGKVAPPLVSSKRNKGVTDGPESLTEYQAKHCTAPSFCDARNGPYCNPRSDGR